MWQTVKISTNSNKYPLGIIKKILNEFMVSLHKRPFNPVVLNPEGREILSGDCQIISETYFLCILN